MSNSLRFARPFAAVVGSLDLGTGVGLVVLPALTLRLMGVAVPGEEALLFVRFVGAFVAAVGGSYLLALAQRKPERLNEVFRVTLLFRFAAGTFVLGAVAMGKLEWPWLSVTATDYLIAAVQFNWLRHGGVRE